MRKGIDSKGVEWEEKPISKLMNNISNIRFGSLIALFPVDTLNNSSYANWLCLCDCGQYVVRSYPSLKGGSTFSCGCTRYSNVKITKMEKQRENIGKQFGKLTILDIVNAPESLKDRRFYYKCICDCGNVITVRATDVKSGKVISCGCAKKDYQASKRESLVGRKFGKLTVVSFSYIKDRTAYWHCKCDCGNETDVRGADLFNGHTSSCGCMLSLGELNIIAILEGAKTKYLHNKGYFKDLVSDSGSILRYDFIIFNNDDIPIRLIEFDGPQHNKPSNLFGVEEFEKLQYHDALKNQYALSHNIPLVRIPYSKRNTIIIEDLFGDQYLIKGDN